MPARGELYPREMRVRGFSVAVRYRWTAGSPWSRGAPVRAVAARLRADALGLAAISHAEWVVLLAGCGRCTFIRQARIMHFSGAGECR